MDRLYIIQIGYKVSFKVFHQPNRLVNVYFIADWKCKLFDIRPVSACNRTSPERYIEKCFGFKSRTLTQIHGCLIAWSAVILFAGLMVSIWLIRFLASGVTVSHSGEGN